MILIIKEVVSFILVAFILLFGVGAAIINYKETILGKRGKLNGAAN